jgi:hypothetical protein
MRIRTRTIAFAVVSVTALAQDCARSDFTAGSDHLKSAVSRLMSLPGYTVWDERILNKSGDLAAVAVMKSVPVQEMTSPEKTRQILLILHLAFEAPQLIVERSNRAPTAAMLLLDKLERTEFGRQPNVISNARFEIEHNTTTGRPLENVSLPGEPVVDWEHTQWVGSVLTWTDDIKPGMTRNDLLRVFTVEGGISTRTRRTYVLKRCPYIHVDVEFSPAANWQDHPNQLFDDKILRISKPYLDHLHID